MMRVIPIGACPGHPPDHEARPRCLDCDRIDPGYDPLGHPPIEPLAYWHQDNPFQKRLICENRIAPLKTRIAEVENQLFMLRAEQAERDAKVRSLKPGETP